MAITDYAVPASVIHAALRAQGVDAVTTVPDFVQFALHDRMQNDPEVMYLQCSGENQAVTSAMGMYIGGRTPIVMLQNQGLFNCINTLRSVGIDAQIPLVFCVGAFGREFSNLGKSLTESRRACVNRVPPVVEALQLPFFNVESTADTGKVAEAFDTARSRECAAILHFGHYLAWT
ncbi:MAG: thiamine pyrophosphate-binding protein [Paracoccus sp. (in: a-proteobacteria)]